MNDDIKVGKDLSEVLEQKYNVQGLKKTDVMVNPDEYLPENNCIHFPKLPMASDGSHLLTQEHLGFVHNIFSSADEASTENQAAPPNGVCLEEVCKQVAKDRAAGKCLDNFRSPSWKSFMKKFRNSIRNLFSKGAENE